MLISVFWANQLSVSKTGFKSIIGFSDLHKNIVLCKAYNFMYYEL